MSAQFTVDVCASCGHAVHPPRVLCPRCSGREWRSRPAPDGVVDEISGHIAAVRADAGPLVIARLYGPAGRGERVRLTSDGGAAVAAGKTSPER